MAERLENVDLRELRRQSRPRYPWDQWTDGSAWKLRQGEDFDSDPEQFRRTIYSHASQHGLSAITRTDPDDPKVLMVQFYPSKD